LSSESLKFCIFSPILFLFWFWPSLIHLTPVGDLLSLITSIIRPVGAVLASADLALVCVGGL
jgi:hypothetical protein